ncbi:acyl-CoA dehydrogenase family protein [Pendulispora albinea]|uniref:Acyl-CoA dehydrogenase family protein n=1 Tax=Pendulispora albinea TaxID=2741071 RepID=A0ABZ2LT42_9BACT
MFHGRCLIAPDTELDRVAAEARSRYGSFLSAAIEPFARDRDAKGMSIPRDAMRSAGELGLLRMAVPEGAGGGGADPVAWGATLEEIGYLTSDNSFPLLVSLRVAVTSAIAEIGRGDLQERYVRPMMAGERAGAFAYTDGTDAFSFATTAEPSGDGFVLRGEKLLVTGGATADTFMTYVRDTRTSDLLVFLVDREDAGVELRHVEVSGFRSAGLCSLHLEDVRVPAHRLMVAADGLGHAQRFLNGRRALLICGVVGRMRAIVESCTRALCKTIRYGQPLTDFQNVQATLGRMYIDLEVTRAIMYRALHRARKGEADPLFDPVTSAAKYVTIERALAIAATAMRLLGGQAFRREFPYERDLRDFTGLVPGAGAQDLLEINLGERVARRCSHRENPLEEA